MLVLVVSSGHDLEVMAVVPGMLVGREDVCRIVVVSLECLGELVQAGTCIVFLERSARISPICEVGFPVGDPVLVETIGEVTYDVESLHWSEGELGSIGEISLLVDILIVGFAVCDMTAVADCIVTVEEILQLVNPTSIRILHREDWKRV